MFNVQLNYNINQALDLEEWDGDFHVISLHGSMEHLVSDVKNIKNSLHRMGKYIKDKTINDNNPNNIKDLDVVATTRHSRTNDLTMSKALSRAIK